MTTIMRRFREPSSWAGIATVMVLLGLTTELAEALVQAGAGIAAVLAILLSEPGTDL